MRLGKKGGVATPCDPYEAKNEQKPQARWKNRKKYSKHSGRESNHLFVIESKKGIDSPTANVHRIGDSHTADAEPNSWASVALTHCAKSAGTLEESEEVLETLVTRE